MFSLPTVSFQAILGLQDLPLGFSMAPISKQVNQETVYPEFNLLIDEGEIYLREEEKVSQRSSISVLSLLSKDSNSSRMKLTPKEILNLPHDLVLAYFKIGHDKDISFYEFDGKRDYFEGEMSSPDMLFYHAGVETCLEVGTTRGSSENTFEIKRKKYQHILKQRYEDCFFFVVSVTHNRVTTNLKLNSACVRHIVNLFRYGDLIRSQASTKGMINLSFDDSIMDFSSEIMNQMRSFSLPTYDDDPMIITKADLQSIKRKPKLTYVSNICREARLEQNKYKEPPEKLIETSIRNFDKYQPIGGVSRMKSVVQSPLISLKKAEVSDYKSYVEGKSTMGNLWYQLLRESSRMTNEEGVAFLPDENQTSSVRFEEKPFETMGDYLKSNEREEKFRTKQERKIKVDLSKTEEAELSQRGYNGKSIKKVFSESARKDIEKELTFTGFDLDTITTDIEEFITDRTWMMNVPLEDQTESCVRTVLQSQLRDGHVGPKRMLDFLNTHLGNSLHFLSCLFTEINLNCRTSAHRYDWNLTYVRNYNILVAIHSVASNKHVFFTVLFPKNSVLKIVGKPFSELEDVGSYYCTKILSTRIADISIFLNSFTKTFSLVSCFSEINKEEFTCKLELYEELMFSILLMLENKEQTSSTLMNLRYMYMEVLKQEDDFCDPFRMLDKFPEIIRSRLLVYAINGIKVSFSNMIMNRPKFLKKPFEKFVRDLKTSEEEESLEDQIIESGDSMSNLISFISGKTIKSFSIAINLSYIGQLHEKTKGEEYHGYLKIYSKVISEELKMRNIRSEYSKMSDLGGDLNTLDSEPNKILRSHEFSVDHMINIARVAREICKQAGFDKETLRTKIMHNLSSQTFEELATFKASCDYTQLKNELKEYGNHEWKSRKKCLTAIVDLIDELKIEHTNPFCVMYKIMKFMKENGGMSVNLFKKEQHQGVREIFVMNIMGRILVRFVESVATTICSIMPNEYLTKGREKSFAAPNHHKKVMKISQRGETCMTAYNSADCTTWCQRFTMQMFGSYYCSFFHDWPEMRETICCILNEVTNKSLELPKELLESFMLRPDIVSFTDKGLNEMKHQFLGVSDFNDLIEPRSVTLKNRSNMMQGVLHFSSSLMHSSHLFWWSSVVRQTFKKLIGSASKVVITTQCSSDDASSMTSIIFEEGMLKVETVRSMLRWSTSLMEIAYCLFGAKNSIKSVTNIFNGVLEFNSSWTIVNTVMTPLIKFSIAAATTRTETTTISRQRTDVNLLKTLIENGSTTSHVLDIETACSINHYSTAGALNTDLKDWSSVWLSMLECRHPSAWYYLLSNPKVGPLLGFDSILYWNILKYPETRRTHEIVLRSHQLEVEEGDKVLSSILPFGTEGRYKKFLRSTKIPTREELVKFYEDDPSTLFDSFDDQDGMMLRIALKAHSLGAAKSFARISASSAMVSSSYILNSPCITMATKTGKFKVSLPYLIKYIIDSKHEGDLNMRELFPYRELYDSVYDFAETLVITKQKTKHGRIASTKFRIPLDDYQSPIPLKDICKHKWFNRRLKHARFLIDMSVRHFTKIHTWLRDDFSSSFSEFKSQFGECDISTFAEIVKNINEKEITISLQTRGPVKRSYIQQITSILKFDYSPSKNRIGMHFKRQASLGQDNSNLTRDLRLIETYLNRLKSYDPVKDPNEAMKKVLDSLSLDGIMFDRSLIESLPKELSKLLLIIYTHKFCSQSGFEVKDDRDKTTITEKDLTIEFFDLLERTNLGTLSWWVHEQKRKRVKGVEGDEIIYYGPGTLQTRIGNLMVRTQLKDDEIMFVETNDIFKFKENMHLYNQALKSACPAGIRTGKRDQNWRSHFRDSRMEVSIVEGEIRVGLDMPLSSPVYNKDHLDFDLKSVKLKVCLTKSRNLALYSEINNCVSEAIVFMPKESHSFDNQNLDSIDGLDGPLSSWLQNKPISDNDLDELIKTRVGYNWFCEIYKKKLSYRRIVPKSEIKFDDDDIEPENKFEVTEKINRFTHLEDHEFFSNMIGEIKDLEKPEQYSFDQYDAIGEVNWDDDVDDDDDDSVEADNELVRMMNPLLGNYDPSNFSFDGGLDGLKILGYTEINPKAPYTYTTYFLDSVIKLQNEAKPMALWNKSGYPIDLDGTIFEKPLKEMGFFKHKLDKSFSRFKTPVYDD